MVSRFVALAGLVLLFSASVRADGRVLTDETRNVLENLKTIGRSRQILYSWCEDWMPDDPADRGRTAPCIRASGGRETLVYNTELYRVTGAYRPTEFYRIGRARTLSLVKNLYRSRKAICVFAWHPENPYVPSGRPAKGAGWNAASPYNYNYKCKGCPVEDRYVIRDILSATNRPCLNGRYPSPRAWFDERLEELASFFRELKDDEGRPIPCAFRLWHECEDDWMWWGKGSVAREDYVAFFRLTVSRLRELTGGGRNILFGYCTDKNWKTLLDKDSAKDWQYRYPGDEFVDLVGLDDYTFGKWPKCKDDYEKYDLNHPDPKGAMEEKLAKSIERLRLVSDFAFRHDKACALFETGFKPNPPGSDEAFCSYLSRALSAEGVQIAFVNTWISSILPKSESGLEDWKAFIAGPSVLMSDAGLDLTRPLPDGRFAEVRRELERQIADGKIDGAVFATNDGVPMTAVGWRHADVPQLEMNTATQFDVASITKTITAACAALLVAEGKVNPLSPFTRYLPDHALGTNCAITVADLAAHVSGFTHYPYYAEQNAESFAASLYSTLPESAPGEKFKYNCYNTILLGKIVERVSGERLDRFAARRIFKPLGMNHSVWGPVTNVNVATFRHARQGASLTPSGQIVDRVAGHVPFPIGNAGLFTTAGDLMLFAEDLLKRRTFPRAYYELLFGCVFDRGGIRRSFGWDMRAEGRPAVCSDGTIFHTGSTGQTLLIDPDRHLAAVLLTVRRCGHDEGIALRRRVMEILARKPMLKNDSHF